MSVIAWRLLLRLGSSDVHQHTARPSYCCIQEPSKLLCRNGFQGLSPVSLCQKIRRIFGQLHQTHLPYQPAFKRCRPAAPIAAGYYHCLLPISIYFYRRHRESLFPTSVQVCLFLFLIL